MKIKSALLITAAVLSITQFTVANQDNVFVSKDNLFKVTVQNQHTSVSPGAKSALALHFELQKNWHFYATDKDAPGMKLRVTPKAKQITFDQVVFPAFEEYKYKILDEEFTIDVFNNKFTVYIPYKAGNIVVEKDKFTEISINLGVDGAYCSNQLCKILRDFEINTKIKIFPNSAMDDMSFSIPSPAEIAAINSNVLGNINPVIALLLAIVAGLTLNIMPCVWPIIPLIIARLIENAKQSRPKSIAMGLVFCLGILLFFTCLATANIILKVFYNKVLAWGDPFRIPMVILAMAILMVVLAMFMFGLFTFAVPSSIAGAGSAKKGFAGALGMGFLAAILSTPCSFAILAAVFAWAQTQKLFLGTIAIMLLGVGMAIPYAIFVSLPHLLEKMPKSGRWMELFKQTTGFILLVIAVKLFTSLQGPLMVGALYLAVIISFAVWMAGSWVNFNTPFIRRWLIRLIALALAITAAWLLLPIGEEKVDWHPYNAAKIETAIEKGQPVLIEFTADWCINCVVVDKVVFANKKIADLIKQKGVLAIKADTTSDDSAATKDWRNIYNAPGVPFSILKIPGKESVGFSGVFFKDKLKQALETLPDTNNDN